MSTAVPPTPSEAAQPGLSEAQRLVDVFVAPSKTFQDIRRNASWWVPWLITAILLGAVLYFYNQKVDLDQVVRDSIANSSRAQVFEGLTKEQQDRQIAIAIKIQKLLPIIAPIVGLVISLIVAAILMAAFNFIHEAGVSYGRSLAILFYGGLPIIISLALTLVTVMVGSDLEARNPRNMVATNPAYFMDYHSASKFLYGMAASLDVITIWTLILIGIGFKVNSAKPKLSSGSAITTVVILYLVWRLVVSGLGWA